MTTSEILRAAKARLTPETWAQSDVPGMHITSGGLCANMAISHSCGLFDPFDDNPAWDSTFTPCALLLAGVATAKQDITATPEWQDAPERTLQDVHEAFDAAISIAEQHEAETLAIDAPEPVLVRV